MRLALFTAVYPAALPYFGAFVASVLRQEDRSADLWIAVDAVAERDIEGWLGPDLNATIVPAPAGATPAEVRTSALRSLLDAGYDGAILVDSDDVLAPSRVAAARDGLA